VAGTATVRSGGQPVAPRTIGPGELRAARAAGGTDQWCAVAFTELVTVLPNNLHDVYKMKIATGAYWTYLADADLDVQGILDIREYTDPHHDATVPHTLILSPGLTVENVYVGYWFWGRPTPHQLWADLQDLFRRTKPDFDPTAQGYGQPGRRPSGDSARGERMVP
jgi:hypothetical protein